MEAAANKLNDCAGSSRPRPAKPETCNCGARSGRAGRPSALREACSRDRASAATTDDWRANCCINICVRRKTSSAGATSKGCAVLRDENGFSAGTATNELNRSCGPSSSSASCDANSEDSSPAIAISDTLLEKFIAVCTLRELEAEKCTPDCATSCEICHRPASSKPSASQAAAPSRMSVSTATARAALCMTIALWPCMATTA
mmetsp:Transcript_115606/g.331956  ORF Transcript_115606/g.331956 Transcript_115606/m.331956 type:complete len:203 (-) Transcript_115606:241-849(-)